MKNADVSRTQGVCQVIYIFLWILLRQGITVPSFIIVGYVWQILGRGPFYPFPIREQPRKDPSWIGLRYFPVNSAKFLRTLGKLCSLLFLNIPAIKVLFLFLQISCCWLLHHTKHNSVNSSRSDESILNFMFLVLVLSYWF